jgi:dTDP-4-amino-4,6-dideoxygalactose transaminase
VTSVPFLDLRAQVAALRGELDPALARVLDRGHFILGPEVEAFERELAEALGVADAVAVANGTEALQLALVAVGVGPGDEVVTSPLSAAFTAMAVLAAGARPVFADLDPRTLNVTPAAVARAITERTRALLPVHLYGHPADMDPLLELAAQRGLRVVEDACQAVGARYRGRPVGALSGLGALSFYPTKNLGALGDGGAILVEDPALAARLRRLRNGGQSERYRHETPGLNSRLDEVQAAVLRVGLGHLAAWTKRRREIAARYRRGLRDTGLVLPVVEAWAEPAEHLFVIRHPRRDALAEALRVRGVGTLVHYPIPLHLQGAFLPGAGAPEPLPVAEAAAREVLSLPLHPGLSDAQAELVVAATREAVMEVAGNRAAGERRA